MLQSTHTHSYMHICFKTYVRACFRASTTHANNSHKEKLGHTIVLDTTTHIAIITTENASFQNVPPRLLDWIEQ